MEKNNNMARFYLAFILGLISGILISIIVCLGRNLT